MNKYILSIKNSILLLFISGLVLSSCKDSFLDEIPLDRFSPEGLLIDSAGFETANSALYYSARQETTLGGVNFDYMNLGTDIFEWGRPDSRAPGSRATRARSPG